MAPLPQQTTPITMETASDVHIPPPRTYQGLKKDHRNNHLQQQPKTQRNRAFRLFGEDGGTDRDELQLDDNNDENVNNIGDAYSSSGTSNSYNLSTVFMDSESAATMESSTRHRHNQSTSFMASEDVVSEEEGGCSELDETNHIFASEIHSAPTDEREYYENSNGIATPRFIDQRCNDQGRHENDDNDNRSICRNNIQHNSDEEASINEAVVGEEEQEELEETEEERRLREEQESEALARQLMAEEAMASYAQSSNFLREHANEYSEEDLRALEALMAEEDPLIQDEEEVDDDVHGGEEGEVSRELSYETLLRLGERMGDVKSERWAMRAQQEIEKLRIIKFDPTMAKGKDENDCCVKCLVCQFQYEEGETIRVLPCGHMFHDECVDQWLSTKDHCPYCRQSIVE